MIQRKRQDNKLNWLVVGAAMLVGLVASLYPAIRAARLDPCTALRSL
jgi:ABC-type lipoprotein release transport system permease subunit